MAKKNNVLGIQKISIGAPGDGVMGASLTDFLAVELNSGAFSGAQANEETIPTEQEDAYLTLDAAANPTTFTFRLFDVTGADAVLLMGGSYDAPSDTWSAPISIPTKYLSVRLTSKVIEDTYYEIDMPYCKVSARHEGTITKSGLLAVEVTCTINTPVTSGDVQNPPYTMAGKTV